MKYEDLSFTVKDEDGNDVICDIVSVVPNENNSDEPYVIFTDYMLDEDDEFVLQYGRVVKENGEYILHSVEDPKEIDLIKDSLKDDIVKTVNKQVEDALK